MKGTDDNFASYTPKPKTVKQQLLKVSKVNNSSFEALKGLFGLLRDDISDEQFQEMLQDAHL